MRAVLAALIVCATVATPASTRGRFHHHSHHHRVTKRFAHDFGALHLVTVETAAGIPITVAGSLADRFKDLIAKFKDAGYEPRHIGCYAVSGHVRNSRHYAGAACDFDQTGWGRTAAFMYHRAHPFIVAEGLRDGCTFRDCGHVDDGRIGGGRIARGRFLRAAPPTRLAPRFEDRFNAID